MLKELLISSINLILEYSFKICHGVFKRITPIKISPKRIREINKSDWESILTLEIKNRLNKTLYDINIAGISKEDLDIEIVSKIKTDEEVKYKMNIDPNHLVLYVEDNETKNKGWIYRLHQIEPKEKIVLKFKLKNKSSVFFKVIHYSFKELVIKERSDGALAIPFVARRLPKI